MNHDPEMMRAVMLEDIQTLRLVRLPIPRVAPGQVLVHVHSSGVNPLDLKISAGVAPHAQHPMPAILGIDVAGTVAAFASDVSGFGIGDEVFGLAGGVGGHPGSLAEYVAVDARLLARKPRNLGMRQAASLPLVFITAWEGLVDRARIGRHDRLLVQGGAGGVGSIAVQLARSFGAQVFATARERHHAYLSKLGAIPIDPGTTTVEQYVQQHTDGDGFDLVYDAVGGAVLDASFNAVGRFGRVVSALGWGTHSLAPLSFKAASYSGVFTLLPLLTGKGREHQGAILREATRLAESGHLLPRIHPRLYTLDAVASAHADLAAGVNEGKVVVSLPSDVMGAGE